ncbi:hypothetical protein CORC01_01013 [Colletotrichum orchidophilum]|uniref:Uncharacterized protein n=1 Tax=Colletotrichum orchidophilum TaxID=1209926 RepID=A0A1G4BQH0_9PEZI|nr:uncharacterized protein CORC01_01013 [Colletotrichum orchidophilum]OHF03694.1 hypothetical protein CORC01_01013 [Colletotrichum orchidophilum]
MTRISRQAVKTRLLLLSLEESRLGCGSSLTAIQGKCGQAEDVAHGWLIISFSCNVALATRGRTDMSSDLSDDDALPGGGGKISLSHFRYYAVFILLLAPTRTGNTGI